MNYATRMLQEWVNVMKDYWLQRAHQLNAANRGPQFDAAVKLGDELERIYNHEFLKWVAMVKRATPRSNLWTDLYLKIVDHVSDNMNWNDIGLKLIQEDQDWRDAIESGVELEDWRDVIESDWELED